MENLKLNKILIAEDTVIQAKALKMSLETLGFTVDWAKNGKEAFELLLKNSYDLLITDVQMPEMDGLELVAKIRTEEKFFNLPLIIVTTLGEVDVKVQALRSGANDFLTKPYSIEELEIRVKNNVKIYYYGKMLESQNANLTSELMVKNAELEDNFRRLQETHQQLVRMQEELVRVGKLNTVISLGSGVAHEINNPLAIISGLNDRISAYIDKGERDFEKFKTITGKISSNVKRISGIIAQLRTLADQDSRQQRSLLKMSSQQFFEMVDPLLRSLVQKPGVDFSTDFCEHNVNLFIRESNLTQVMMNLLENALDAIENQPEKKIQIRTRVDENSFVIDIKDNGPGISHEIQEKVFDPFFTTKGPQKATGMGLTLCQAFLHNMKGEITFASSNEGTVFSIRLPCAQLEEAA